MAIGITGKFKPEGDYPLVDAEDVQMPDGKRLSEFNANGIEVDASFNAESENPVMNKTITAAMTQALGKLTTIQQNITTLQKSALPTVTTEDNGRVPQVVDGALVYTDVADLQIGDKSLPTYISDAVNTYIEEALGGDY